jgi:hypothetical protein
VKLPSAEDRVCRAQAVSGDAHNEGLEMNGKSDHAGSGLVADGESARAASAWPDWVGATAAVPVCWLDTISSL